MAVDIKSLHIGSHIAINGKRHRISNIDALNGQIGIEAYTTDKDGVKHPFGYPIEQIEPIAITPELLKELGFKYRTPICIWIKASEDEYLSFEQICGTNRYRVHLYSGDIDRGKCVCRYLHEAEAFLALYGVELIPD